MSKTKKIAILSIMLISILYDASVHAVTTINSIRFEGNETTKEIFLRREMYFTEGDVFDETRLADSIQALVDTGLFTNINYYISSDIPEDELATDSQIDLVIQVKEKYYLLLLPRIRVKENETNIGLQLRWDNLFGMNHSLRFLEENRGSTGNIDESRTEFDYTYPNVKGSRYSLNFSYAAENKVDNSNPGLETNRIDQSLGVSVSRWLNSSGRNFGWFANVGWSVRERENDLLDNLLADEKLSALVLSLEYGFAETHDYGYNRSGKEFGYKVDMANRIIHSDTEFARHELYYRSYYRFKSRPLDNLNVQTILGHASHDIMGNQAFNIGGDNLRGYETARFEDNAMLLINMEYVTPLQKYPQLRFVSFVDLGNTYADVEDVVHGGLKTGVGFGLRWKIRSFVKLSLRVDLGYGISDQDYRITAGTSYSY